MLRLLFEWYLLLSMPIVITIGVGYRIQAYRSTHSKRRKNHSAELPDMIANIAKCASEKDALDVTDDKSKVHNLVPAGAFVEKLILPARYKGLVELV